MSQPANGEADGSKGSKGQPDAGTNAAATEPKDESATPQLAENKESSTQPAAEGTGPAATEPAGNEPATAEPATATKPATPQAAAGTGSSPRKDPAKATAHPQKGGHQKTTKRKESQPRAETKAAAAEPKDESTTPQSTESKESNQPAGEGTEPEATSAEPAEQQAGSSPRKDPAKPSSHPRKGGHHRTAHLGATMDPRIYLQVQRDSTLPPLSTEDLAKRETLWAYHTTKDQVDAFQRSRWEKLLVPGETLGQSSPRGTKPAPTYDALRAKNTAALWLCMKEGRAAPSALNRPLSPSDETRDEFYVLPAAALPKTFEMNSARELPPVSPHRGPGRKHNGNDHSRTPRGSQRQPRR